jgi:predicted SAM-dependent methyltransferase
MCNRYQSETSQFRDQLAPYCTGYGLDIGFGGDPITPQAVRMDLPQPYANTGDLGVQLGGDCRDLRWFRDEVLDFVYSSHVLEDFPEDQTANVMREWARVLKPGGQLVLLLPDQPRYSAHCTRTGQPRNEHHSIDHFSLEYVTSVALRLGTLERVAALPELGVYSFGVVFKKVKSVSGSADRIGVLEGQLAEAYRERDSLQLRLNRIQGQPGYRLARKFFLWLRAKRG